MTEDIWGQPWRPCDSCPHATPLQCPARAHRAYCNYVAAGRKDMIAHVATLPPESRAAKDRQAAIGPLEGDRGGDVPMARPLRKLEDGEWITCATLASYAQQLAALLPSDVDAVVGIARSGLLVATPIALSLHLPLWITSQASENLVPAGHGQRLATPIDTPLCAALIDDTVASGQTMTAAYATVRRQWPECRVVRAVAIASPWALPSVHHCVATVPGHHYLEWNLWNSGATSLALAYDFDGVLCHDMESGGPIGTPLYLPRREPVALIVTGRHERDRAETEGWLTRHGVRCEKLVMRTWEPETEAEYPERCALWKATHYAASDCTLFVESDPAQAKMVNEATGRPVLCPRLGKVLPPGPRQARYEPTLPSLAHQAGGFLQTATTVVLGGFQAASDELVQRRLVVCQGCDHYRPSDGRCGQMTGCGCFVAEKATWRASQCPEGLWPEE